jgi:hypothetical protein
MAVNLSPVGGVAAQFFTSTGAVLTGGKLYTYAAGTTTPAVTYTTSQGNVPWTNPVVLDAAGRVPGSGEIWLTDGIIYKFVLKDSNDVLIATYDNITGINSNAVAYTNQQEIVTATAGQTVFNLGISYQPGTNSLSVFVDGVNQYGPGAQYAYTETSSTSVTFNSGLHVGAEVKFTTTQQQGAGAVDASQVTYDPPFTGSAITNVEAKLAQTISVIDFGAVDDNLTNNTSAIIAAAAYLQSQGGGTLLFPFTDTGIYRVTPAIGSIIADFADLDGIQILFQGTTLKDDQTYTTAQESVAFRFVRCKNIAINANIESELIVTGASPAIRGLVGVKLEDNCTNFDIKLTMVGGKDGVWVYRDPATQGKARQGRVAVDCTSVLYPYAGTFSGDDVRVQINATLCGRNFFIYGVQNNWISVDSKNQQVTSLIAGSGGGAPYAEGCQDIWVTYFDRNSDNGPGAPLMEMVFRDSALNFSNINISVDVACPASRPWGTTFRFIRTDSTTGHELNNFTLSGRSEMSNSVSNAHLAWSGFTGAPLTVRNFNVVNFYAYGANTSFSADLLDLQGPTAIFQNVICETPLNVENGGSGNVTFISCSAPYATNGSDYQTYINCNWTDAVAPNLTNKVWVNSKRGTDTYTNFTDYVFSPGLWLIDGVSAPSTVPGYAGMYVDSADGDLKIKFGDGTVKTIVTDT